MILVIILEGPDGAGKSTLLTRLQTGLAEYGIHPGVHAGTPNRDRMWETTVDRTYDAIGRDLNPAHPPLMWDRMFYSELVYSPIMGRSNAFGTTANYVHRLITYTGSPVIFCMPPLSEVINNVAATKQHEWVSGNEEKIYQRYQQIISRFGNPNTFLWNYVMAESEPTMWPKLINNLRIYINKRRTVA